MGLLCYRYVLKYNLLETSVVYYRATDFLVDVTLTLLTMAQFPTDSLWGGVVTSPSKFNIS